MQTTLEGGSPDAVFAEARDRDRWRDPLRDRGIADRARGLVDRALAEAGTPIARLGFQAYRRYDDDGDRAQYEAAYLGIRKRLFAAAIGALLSDDVPISAVEESLWAICEEYVWAFPAHIPELSSADPEIPHHEIIDLFSAETAFALAEIAALLGDRLHPLVVARVRREVERRVLTPFRARTWFWESAETNWSAVCAAGVGIAAIHLETEGLAGILDRCTAAMDALLAGYGDDGACIEGLNYWNYGFGHFAYYAEALRQRTGIDLWSGPHRHRLSAIARYPLQVSLGGRAVAAFADAEPYGTVAPALSGLLESMDPSNAVPREFLSGGGWEHNWGSVIRQFVWARDTAEEALEAPARTVWFSDAEWLVMREAVGPHDVGFAAKAGHNDEPHNHNDVGSFLLAVNGEPLLSELGMGHYDRSYFLLESRYEHLVAGSQGHSVPSVAGVRQHHGRDARAVVEEVSPDAGRLVMDLTAAYRLDALQSVRRSLVFAGGRLIISDEFTASAALEFTDRLVSLFPIELGDGEAIIRGERGAVRVTWPREWAAELSSELFRAHGGAQATAHLLDLRCTASEARCVITVVPLG